MLHLDSRVHLNKDVLAFVWAHGIHQELDRSRVLVTELLCEVHCIFIELLAQGLVDVWGRSYFDYFLVSALDGAVAFK